VDDIKPSPAGPDNNNDTNTRPVTDIVPVQPPKVDESVSDGSATAPAEGAAESTTTSVSEPAPAVKTVTSKPPKIYKYLLSLFVLMILVAIGVVAYWWQNHSSVNQNPTSSVTVKKDISNIRYVTTNSGWETFYPANDTSSNYQEINIMTFEGLVRFENKTQIVPLLATGWTNPDSSTWVFNLRSGVKFHSGRTMTAQDVKDSFEAAKDSDAGSQLATTIKSITVSGPLQVTIKTDGPDPTLLKKLTDYYVYDTKSGKANDVVNGTGPFVVKPGTTPKTDSLELVAFDQYWGGRPHVRSFSFVGIDSNDHGKAYGTGQANLQAMFADKPTATGNRAYKSLPFDQASVFIMPLNTLKAGSPLQKLPVRQAIEDSLDPAALAKVREVEATAATQIIPKSLPGYDPTLTRPPRDVTKAKQLLTQAGYPKGFSMTLTYFSPSQSTAVEIQKELAESGITVVLDPQTEVKTLSAKAYGGGTDAFFITFSSEIFDASDILSSFTGSDNKNNDDPAIDALLAKAGTTLNESQRLNYLKQATHLMSQSLAVEPIFSESGDQIIYDPSFVIQRDVASTNLGIYFQKVYAK